MKKVKMLTAFAFCSIAANFNASARTIIVGVPQVQPGSTRTNTIIMCVGSRGVCAVLKERKDKFDGFDVTIAPNGGKPINITASYYLMTPVQGGQLLNLFNTK